VKIDVGELIKSIAFNSDGIKTLNNDMKRALNDMKILTSELESLRFQVNKEKKRNNILQDKLIQIESQSRRDNLLMEGIPESDHESWTECEKKVKVILEHKMKIQNVKDFKFVRYHRLGPKLPNTVRPRMVIFKLHWFKDREAIWNKKNELKNTNIWLKEDFPAEINRRRSVLLPIFHEARKLNKVVSLRVDRLVLEGKTFTVDTLSQLPDDLQPTKLATHTENGVTAFFRSASPLSMFHPVQIKDTDNNNIYHCGEQWLHREKALFFKDESTAADIMMAETAVECKTLGRNVKNFNDDQWYKSGHARKIVKKINMAKFQQNPELLTFLKNTAPVLAEANPYDKHWGVGTGINDKKTYNKDQWQGSNDLGKILVQVKTALST
jgi:ribA/ribD-fused uncharacterized protein